MSQLFHAEVIVSDRESLDLVASKRPLEEYHEAHNRITARAACLAAGPSHLVAAAMPRAEPALESPTGQQGPHGLTTP